MWQHRGDGQTAELRPAPEIPGIHSQLPADQTSSVSRSLVASSRSSTACLTNASPLTSQSSDQEVASMRVRIQQLEDQLSRISQKAAQTPVQAPDSPIEIITSGTGETFTVHQKRRSFGQASIVRHIIYKTRLFGRSHWMHGAIQVSSWAILRTLLHEKVDVSKFQDTFKIIEPYLREEMSKVNSGLQNCKNLAKNIKLQRSAPWSSTPIADIPPKDVADKLVDCYLRTIEIIYRILHIPTLRRDYEKLWLSGTKPDTAFMIQLKLVLAIGATVYDEQFSLRASAILWVHEAQRWLSEPVFKPRLSIQSLQINLLFLIARETVAVGGELIWISAGSLIRTAVHMGLHQDPARLSNMTTFAAEMRRRLWNTVLEITLRSSMDSGGPPFISLDDFDAAPPGNFDDDQLMTDNAISKPEEIFTQTSIAIDLRKTFPLRLSITKFLNDIGSSGSYDETLRLDLELRAAYKTLSRTIRTSSLGTGRSLSQFEKCVVDILMLRYLSSLHIPFFDSSLHETAYAFSRKAVIETALKIWGALNPSSSIMATPSRTSTTSLDQDDLVRLVTCGAGFFRNLAFQAGFVIAAELRTQICESESLGPEPLRPDLLSVMDDAKTLTLRCIEAGETNIKNYLLICVVSAQINGLMQGVPKDIFPKLLIKAAEDAVETCVSIFKGKPAQCPEEVVPDVDGLCQESLLNVPADLMEGWDFMVHSKRGHHRLDELLIVILTDFRSTVRFRLCRPDEGGSNAGLFMTFQIVHF